MSTLNEAINFERRIGAIYRTLGATVKHNVPLAGNQIDLLVIERTPSGNEIQFAIECKYYSKPVGVEIVNAFASLCLLLKDRNLVNRGIIVSKSGFTTPARNAGETHGIELLELADLEQRAKGLEEKVADAVNEAMTEKPVNYETGEPKRVFVVMPFTSEFNDVYVLGIREVAERLGIIVERADNIEHNQSILDLIKAKIIACDLVVAETTVHNPNVFYEVGFAHGISKETILICKEVEQIPFDLAQTNHVVYSGIVELREKLEKRLIASLNLSA